MANISEIQRIPDFLFSGHFCEIYSCAQISDFFGGLEGAPRRNVKFSDQLEEL